MDRIGQQQVRLQLPYPYVLLYGLAPRTTVQARVHGWINQAAAQYAFDYGVRPAAYNVPPGAAPPAAVSWRNPAQIVIYAQGTGPVAPAVHSDEYGYQYDWTPFAPAVQGNVVPHGKAEENFAMPDIPVGPPKGVQTPDDIAVLRFRWRGTANAAVAVFVAPGGSPGPFTLDLTNGGVIATPIVPGTVYIQAPIAGPATIYARDLPWPTAQEAITCRTGRIIGDVDPGVDSVIDYYTGQAVVTFNQNIVAGNILSDHESAWAPEPMDIRAQWDVNTL